MSKVNQGGTRTADLLSQSDELPDGSVGSSDTANNRPLALKVDRSRDHVGEILHGGESDTVVFTTIQHKSSTVIEVA
jgi:hypothetical protein